MTNKRIACRRVSLADDPQVPSTPSRTRHGLRKIHTAVVQIDIRARPARLRYFQNDVVPCKSIADVKIILVGSQQCEIFPERTSGAFEAFFGVPPRPVGSGIGGDRLVGSAVQQAINLLISGNTFAAEENDVGGNRRLADR